MKSKNYIPIFLFSKASENLKGSNVLSDEELVRRIVTNNDAVLFGKLYDRFSNKIYHKCLSFASNRAEAQDLTQDIFLKLYTKLWSYEGKAKFSTWLYSFTYNFLVNYKKRDANKRLGERWEIFPLRQLFFHLRAVSHHQDSQV